LFCAEWPLTGAAGASEAEQIAQTIESYFGANNYKDGCYLHGEPSLQGFRPSRKITSRTVPFCTVLGPKVMIKTLLAAKNVV
jgi:hypothetical protein